ncbi:MAG: hypothetical protein U0O03_00175 [Blautia wexlerae]
MTSIVHQTDLAQTIDLAAERARYDECAKKLLTYKAVAAWILKSCTKEFSQYSVTQHWGLTIENNRKDNNLHIK